MHIRKSVLITLTVLMSFALTFAQTHPTEAETDKLEKQKGMDERIVKMLDQAIMEGGTLRLPQNRAVIYAITGDLYWKFDDKRGRELFRNAATELVAYNQEIDKERRESDLPTVMQYVDFSKGPRGEILPLIAARDAELALELLIQTRPARLAEEMLRAAAPNAKQSSSMNFDPERQWVRQEIALEQQFALAAADENPEKAIKMIRQSLSQGISTSVLPLLQKLHKKDGKKAEELGGEVVRKLIDADLLGDEEDLRTAVSFLQFSFAPSPATGAKIKPFSFHETVIKELAGKVANTMLQPSRSMILTMILSQAMPLLEKFLPERSAQLRQRQSEMQGELPVELASMQRNQKLYDPNSTPEEILDQIPKLQNDIERSMAYQSFSNKVVQIDDDARARKLIDQIPDEKVRANALEQWESRRISRSASAGKLDDAQRMIRNLTKKKTQIQKLVALAVEYHKKQGEDEIAAAKELMAEARGLIRDHVETSDDLGDMMELIKGYSTVEPDIAFKMFESAIDTLNEHIQASAVIARFNSQSTHFRNGELVMKATGSDFPLFRYIAQMRMLGKADLERMISLVDRFHRNDARAIVKLYVLQGFIKDEKQISVQPAPGTVNFVIDQ